MEVAAAQLAYFDDQTGRISDVPWEALEVKKVATLDEFDVAEYQVVLRGRRRGPRDRKN